MYSINIINKICLKSFSYTLLTINNNYQLYIVRDYYFNNNYYQQRKVSSYI